MCAAVIGLLMPILTLPVVFGGLRAIPMKPRHPHQQAHVRSVIPALLTEVNIADASRTDADGSTQVCCSFIKLGQGSLLVAAFIIVGDGLRVEAEG
jgi:hypothetical protein